MPAKPEYLMTEAANRMNPGRESSYTNREVLLDRRQRIK
jgi:hypothetical protein